MEAAEKKGTRKEQRDKIKEDIRSLSSEDLIYIPAKKSLPATEDSPKKRTAAYCRVSTEDPAQTTSYELQKEHYEEEINKNPEWVFAGIYADEGISATSMKHRDNFNRLIADCEAGKIDVIVTKSVSRFARNVVDCLSTVRHLAALNPPVAVKFETEGINTLDSASEMILTVMAAAAQEESKTKSNAMIWSLEKRFEKGRFLTPVLLGYDHDEDGKLVINEEESQTVRLMYYLYLSGFPIPEIAEILTQLKRKTKLGNTKWYDSTVRAVMQNERHCGNVLSWKTFTYDFWEHKKRKNNQDMPQVLKVDHHEAIVSHEIFDAAQSKMAAEKNMKKSIPMPALEVIEEGVLTGFVPVNLLWRGFTVDDYVDASSSVGDPKENEAELSGTGEFSLDGYKIVRSCFFSSSQKPTMSIAKGQVRFSTYCLKKFVDVEYVELLFNPVEHCIAVRPCERDNPNAVRWGRLKDSRWIVQPKSCSGFMDPLYHIMSWRADCGYKLFGQYLEQDGDRLLVFDLSDPVVSIFEEKEEQTSESASEDAPDGRDDSSGDIKIRLMKREVLPDTWGYQVGQESSWNAVSLKAERYKGDWRIMSPAAFYRMGGNISETTMEQVRNGALELWEKLKARAEGADSNIEIN
ncbi:MAG: recombinase family protein [Oribacterium sp.]|nr:recombinase family protein [Oribacterium sp.]